MSFSDLAAFLHFLEQQGDCKRIKVEVDPELEITEIAVRVVKSGGPALLFENVKGTRFPLAINIFGTARRIEWALGEHPQKIGEEIVKTIERLNPPSLRSIWQERRMLKKLRYLKTKIQSTAPCQEVVEKSDLGQLPIIKCWPLDSGRFITFPLVLTQDPETKKRNLGIYRMQVYTNDKTGMHWQIQKGGGFHYWKARTRGETLPVSVVLGGDPILLLASVAPLPEGMDEVAFSGFLRGQPTLMTKAKTSDHLVPANAEFILEGTVAPEEQAMEGPFGDHFGHYSHVALFPVFQIKVITRKKNPIYPCAVVGKPPQEDKFMGEAMQELFIPLIKMMRPEICDLWAYYEAGFHNLLVVSVQERYKKEALKTAFGLMGEGQLSLTKCLILVDAIVNVRDFRSVLRAIRKNFEPATDFVLLAGAPLDTLDFTSYTLNLGSKMILDATSSEEKSASRAEKVAIDPGSIDPRIRAWKILEEVLLICQVEGEGRELIQKIIQHNLGSIKIAGAVSADVPLNDPELLLWGLFTRFDAARDIIFTKSELHGPTVVNRGIMGIDATWKKGYPQPIEMDSITKKKVDSRWHEYRI